MRSLGVVETAGYIRRPAVEDCQYHAGSGQCQQLQPLPESAAPPPLLCPHSRPPPACSTPGKGQTVSVLLKSFQNWRPPYFRTLLKYSTSFQKATMVKSFPYLEMTTRSRLRIYRQPRYKPSDGTKGTLAVWGNVWRCESSTLPSATISAKHWPALDLEFLQGWKNSGGDCNN